MRNHAVVNLGLSRTLAMAVAVIGSMAAFAPTTSAQAPAGQQGGPIGGGGTPVAKEYRITSISIKGNKLFNGSFTQQVLGLAVGDVYSDESLRKGFENLKQVYGVAGYINLVPTPNFLFDEARKFVDLTIEIEEGRQYTVNRIRFTGNTTTPEDVLRNNIALKEGAVFNATSWSLSMLRLNQMGLFEEIKPEDTSIRPLGTEPKVDLDLRLKEKAR